MCDFFFLFDFEVNLKLFYKEQIFVRNLKNCYFVCFEFGLVGICDFFFLNVEIKSVYYYVQ